MSEKPIVYCDGSIRSALINASLRGIDGSVAPREEVDQIAKRVFEHAEIVDFGALNDPLISLDLAREVARSSGHVLHRTSLMFAGRLSRYVGSELVPFAQEMMPIARLNGDLHDIRHGATGDFQYTQDPVVVAWYAGTDSRFMQARGDSWEALMRRTGSAARVTLADGLRPVVVLQSAREVAENIGQRFIEECIDNKVDEIWVADTDAKAALEPAIDTAKNLMQAYRPEGRIGFIGMGDTAVVRTREAIRAGADVVYAVERNYKDQTKFATFGQLRRTRLF